MSDEKIPYKTIHGVVQFGPDEREVTTKNGDMLVRDVQVRVVGGQQMVRVTLWPQFANVDIEIGDAITVDGQMTTNEAQNKNGETVTYFNMSAKTISIVPGITGEPQPDAPAPKKSTAKKSSASPF